MTKTTILVIPGEQRETRNPSVLPLDSRLRGNDGGNQASSFYLLAEHAAGSMTRNDTGFHFLLFNLFRPSPQPPSLSQVGRVAMETVSC